MYVNLAALRTCVLQVFIKAQGQWHYWFSQFRTDAGSQCFDSTSQWSLWPPTPNIKVTIQKQYKPLCFKKKKSLNQEVFRMLRGTHMRKHVQEPGKYFPPMLHILHAVGSRNSGLWDSKLGGSSVLGHCLVLSCRWIKIEWKSVNALVRQETGCHFPQCTIKIMCKFSPVCHKLIHYLVGEVGIPLQLLHGFINKK